MLRYGDGTPFPFEDGFLDMLVDAVEACTAMLAATADLDRKRAEAEAVMREIGEEERRLVLFERTIAAACTPDSDGKPTPAVLAAEQTRNAMRTAVEQSREQLRQISAVQAAPPSWRGTAQRVHTAAGRFFTQRLLPATRWAWAWDASGDAAHAEAASQDPRFRIVFDLELPAAWQAPVRIDALAPNLIVQLPRHRWLRSTIETAIPLGRCFLVAARHDERGRELVIRKPDGAGWRIDLPQDGQASAAALDRRGREVGSCLVRETELAALLTALDRELPTMKLPRQPREVLLDAAAVTEMADTTLAARALLEALGPTVREIRQRSKMSGELTLKRDIVDGKREELYISRAALTAAYANLPDEYRRLLDQAGFGRGLTTGIAELASEAPAPAPARPAPAPAPAAARSSSPALLARSSSPAVSAIPAPVLSARASSPEVAPARPSPSPRTRHQTQPLLTPGPARPSRSQPRATRISAEEVQQRAVDPTMPSILAAPPYRRLLTPTG